MRYYLGLYLIRDVPLVLDIGIPFRVNSPPISQRYDYGCA